MVTAAGGEGGGSADFRAASFPFALLQSKSSTTLASKPWKRKLLFSTVGSPSVCPPGHPTPSNLNIALFSKVFKGGPKVFLENTTFLCCCVCPQKLSFCPHSLKKTLTHQSFSNRKDGSIKKSMSFSVSRNPPIAHLACHLHQIAPPVASYFLDFPDRYEL